MATRRLLQLILLGPTHWGEQYNTCKGKHQSPININTLDLLYVSMPPLKMVGFKTPPLVTSLTNNGHTGESLLIIIT